MEKEGCEIEALDIDYNIFVSKINVNPFGIFTRKPHQEPDQKTEEETWKLEQGTSNKVKHVLKGVTCRAKPWEILAIVGPSGAGKSSLLEILAARLLPQTGSELFSKNIFRNKELFACRTVQMLGSGIVLGLIFHNLGDDLKGARERVGLFAFILTFLLTSTIEALPIFLQEREILMKETSSGSYRVSSYVVANGLVYLPFLLILAILFTVPVYWLVGLNPNFMAFLHFLLLIWLILYTPNSVVVCLSALVPNFIVGKSLISGVMCSFFLFSGYFISKHEIPGYWIFMHYISLFKYPL